MAKIATTKLLILLLLIISSFSLKAQTESTQNKKKVEIDNTDVMISEGNFRRLVGNVELRHKEMIMTCDSAHYFDQADLVKAYSKVHISKGDTLHIYGDYLIYDSNNENAEVFDNVILIDKETTLLTDHIFYDMITEVANYDSGGKILNEENVLTSIIGTYYSETEVFNFKDSVELVNPDYTMYADTLVYDTKTEIAYFLGPTRVVGDSLDARCQEGWYDTRNEKSLLLYDAMVDNKVQVITGDSIYYENDNGYGTAYYDVTITDLSKDIIVKGNKSWYYKEPERFMMTDSAQFIQIQDDDFLFLHADTLWSITESYTMKVVSQQVYDMHNDSIVPGLQNDSILIDSLVNYRLLRAYDGCRIFSTDLQARCDSLAYSFRDSVIRMYYEPVIWSDENQLTSDSMFLYTENDEMSMMRLFNNAFVIEEVDPTRYQQIKGKNLTGYFKDNSINKIEVSGNGENIYFALEKEELVGVNQSTCANMDIYLDNGKIEQIYFLKNPDGSLDPPLHKQPGTRRLKSFIWLESIRPKNRYDIFRDDGGFPVPEKAGDEEELEEGDDEGKKVPDKGLDKKKSRNNRI